MLQLIILLAAVAVVLWIIRSIGQTYIMRTYNRKAPGAVWVPVIGMMVFVWGMRDDKNNLNVCGADCPAIIPSLFVIWGTALAFIPVVGWIFAWLCSVIFYGAACTKVYTDFYCGQVRYPAIALIGYVSGLIPLIATVHFFVLCCRRWKPEDKPHGIPARKNKNAAQV